jgi:hypothetical protein
MPDQGRRVRQDGSAFWANVVITAVFDGNGRLEGFAKVCTGETERMPADEHVRRHALLADRERIAADLHQSIVHRIVEAGLHVQRARNLITDPEHAGVEHRAEPARADGVDTGVT